MTVLTGKTLELKSPREIDVMREAGRIVAEVLAHLAKIAGPGVATSELDRAARQELNRRGAKPAFLNYRGFPAVLCVSINCEVVHGIPSPRRRLLNGDIVSLDLGCILNGFYADAAVTIGIGSISPQAQRLLSVTREALLKGVEAMKLGGRLGDISCAVQTCAEAAGFSVVRDFVGHGVGRSLHEDPQVPNYGKAGSGARLSRGLVLAIEPMVTAGSPEVKIMPDGWTAVTVDGSLAAHFEHTIALMENGPEILTLTR